MIRKFVNRKKELKALEKYYDSEGFEFIVVYGRRRIGKTAIIKEFIKDKPSLYFLCDKRGSEDNIKRLKKMFYDLYGVPILESNDLEEVIRHALTALDFQKKFVLVFDEFPYLIEKDEAMISVFQRMIDNVLSTRKVMIILLGSSISMMENYVLSYTSPLYGRKTYALKVNPLRFKDYFSFYSENDAYKNVEFYTVTSGIPGYMIFLDDKKSLEDNILEEMASVQGRLFYEIDFLLRIEFREPETYKKILEAIAKGHHKVVEIANAVNMMPNVLSNYLKNLLSLGLIYKEITTLSKKVKPKKVRYVIADKFIEFYMLFIDPFRSDLEIDYKKRFIENLNKNLNKYIGEKFEELVRRELIKEINPNYDAFIKYITKTKDSKIVDIDVLGINHETKEMLAVEVKWKTLKLRDVKQIIDDLQEKLQYVDWYKDERREIFGIFAKKVEKKAKEWLISQGYKVWDLGDIKKKGK